MKFKISELYVTAVRWVIGKSLPLLKHFDGWKRMNNFQVYKSKAFIIYLSI